MDKREARKAYKVRIVIALAYGVTQGKRTRNLELDVVAGLYLGCCGGKTGSA
jgi:hypothetical protein